MEIEDGQSIKLEFFSASEIALAGRSNDGISVAAVTKPVFS